MRRLWAVLLGVTLTVAVSVGADETSQVADLYRTSYQAEARGDYVGALARMREIAGKTGSSYFVQVRMAWLSYAGGDSVASERLYREASASAPKSVESRIGLTLPLMALQKWRDLERACRDVLALDAGHAIARARLAHALYALGNYPDAATQYRKLVEDYPADLDHQTGLGWALLRMGRRAEARQMFAAVLAVSPDNANAKAGMAAP